MVKNPLANAGDSGDVGSILGLGRFRGEGNVNPLEYSCLENPMDREAWWVTVHGVTKSRTQLSNWVCTHAIFLDSEKKGVTSTKEGAVIYSGTVRYINTYGGIFLATKCLIKIFKEDVRFLFSIFRQDLGKQRERDFMLVQEMSVLSFTLYLKLPSWILKWDTVM